MTRMPIIEMVPLRTTLPTGHMTLRRAFPTRTSGVGYLFGSSEQAQNSTATPKVGLPATETETPAGKGRHAR